MTSPRLYAHALRAARLRQLRGRALRPLNRRRFDSSAPPRPAVPLPGAVALWRSDAFAGQGFDAPGRLAVFHSHYGEDVLAHARAGELDAARDAIDRWIAANPPAPGDAWHPYPLSTRVGNWIAALSLLPALAGPALDRSLWRQLRYLARNVEDDILGNHVIRNARALVLGGAAFRDDALLERGRALLRRELPEQVLPDGGHYERSPTYHLVVLRDLLELEAAAGIGAPIEPMRRFAAALARPDGAPALFNDGGLDLAPKLELPVAPDGLTVFPETGYAVVRTARIWLAFDCGPPAPAYLPPHAHADALSFQLWIDGKPVVVDPGTYTYEPGPDRDWFRGTRAHSTVTVDGRDQFELWGAFRAGRLPRVRLLGTDPLEAEVVTPWYRHVRRIAWSGGEVVVHDTVEGGRAAESSLPVTGDHPVEALAGTARSEPSWLSERFGERRQIAALVQRFTPGEPSGWRIRPSRAEG